MSTIHTLERLEYLYCRTVRVLKYSAEYWYVVAIRRTTYLKVLVHVVLHRCTEE